MRVCVHVLISATRVRDSWIQLLFIVLFEYESGMIVDRYLVTV